MQILRSAHRFQMDVKKSQFIALAFPVNDKTEAEALIAKNCDPKARHNCWAYRVGDSFRFSDDGEPSGTAGKPILAAIDNNNFDNCLVLVIRFFGGIKLGTGGLARAYGGSASECLMQADSKPLIATVSLTGFCPYPELGSLKAGLENAGATISNEDFGSEGVTLVVQVPTSEQSAISQLLKTLTRGQQQFTKI